MDCVETCMFTDSALMERDYNIFTFQSLCLPQQPHGAQDKFRGS